VIVAAEGQLRSIAAGLCNFNGKQLQAVSHLLSAEHVKQVKIGMDIPPTNQVGSSPLFKTHAAEECCMSSSPLLGRYTPSLNSSSLRSPVQKQDCEQCLYNCHFRSLLVTPDNHVCLLCCCNNAWPAGPQEAGGAGHEAPAFRPR